ncbi:CBS domain-containing protein [Candidatus Filomicrobium marinum]|nr:CBS domain-containing protein [Candidatus Filomicrobium marinum]
MTRQVVLIHPNTTILDAAKKMRAEDVGALPVGENDRLIGMVTDRDTAMRAVAEDRAPAETTVREVMSDDVYYCFEEDDAEVAAASMARHQVRRLPVLNADKRLVGFVALADFGRKEPQSGQTALEGISESNGETRR